MHHAAFLLVRGDVRAAWTANPLVFVVAPLLSYLYVRHALVLWRKVFG